MENIRQIYFQFNSNLNKGPGEPIVLDDIIDINCSEEIEDKLKAIVVYPRGLQGPVRVTALDIIRIIQKSGIDRPIISIGSSAVLLTPEESSSSRSIIHYIKVAVSFVLLFIGSALAIMYFHTDVNMAETHQMAYYIITGEKVKRPLLLSIPYSIGIGIGIALFFNLHSFNRKKDPGPLELEMYQNERELTDYLTGLEEDKNKK